jgi:hypothetical protein
MLSAGSKAVDAGAVLPNIADRFEGEGPDIGAWETGRPIPHYGPDPEVQPVDYERLPAAKEVTREP